MFSGWSGWCKSLNTNSFDHIASSLVVFAPNEIAQLNHYNHACKCSKQNTSFFLKPPSFEPSKLNQCIFALHTKHSKKCSPSRTASFYCYTLFCSIRSVGTAIQATFSDTKYDTIIAHLKRCERACLFRYCL